MKEQDNVSMVKFSDTIRSFPLDGFEITGNLTKDIRNFLDYKKIPYKTKSLDENLYLTVLYRLSFGKK